MEKMRKRLQTYVEKSISVLNMWKYINKHGFPYRILKSIYLRWMLSWFAFFNKEIVTINNQDLNLVSTVDGDIFLEQNKQVFFLSPNEEAKILQFN